MKNRIYLLFLTLLSVACNAPVSKINLNPNLELIDNESLRFEGIDYQYSEIDSVLSVFILTVPQELKDSIRVELVVNVNIVTMGKVGEIKIALRKNDIKKVIYKPKNDVF